MAEPRYYFKSFISSENTFSSSLIRPFLLRLLTIFNFQPFTGMDSEILFRDTLRICCKRNVYEECMFVSVIMCCPSCILYRLGIGKWKLVWKMGKGLKDIDKNRKIWNRWNGKSKVIRGLNSKEIDFSIETGNSFLISYTFQYSNETFVSFDSFLF